MSLTYEKWIEIYTAKDGSYEKDYLINSAHDLIRCQQIEIDILIRKKKSLRNEICELQSEIERLKEFEYAYNSLFK
jgi:FtsZ-binding cell division protein ZapB